MVISTVSPDVLMNKAVAAAAKGQPLRAADRDAIWMISKDIRIRANATPRNNATANTRGYDKQMRRCILFW